MMPQPFILNMLNFEDENYQADHQIYKEFNDELSTQSYLANTPADYEAIAVPMLKEIPFNSFQNKKFIDLSFVPQIKWQADTLNNDNSSTVSGHQSAFFKASSAESNEKAQLITANLEDFAKLIYEADEINEEDIEDMEAFEDGLAPTCCDDEDVSPAFDPFKGDKNKIFNTLCELTADQALVKFYQYPYSDIQESGVSFLDGYTTKTKATKEGWKAFYQAYLASTEHGPKCLAAIFMKAVHRDFNVHNFLELLTIWPNVQISSVLMARVLNNALKADIEPLSYAGYELLKSRVTLDVTPEQPLIVKLSDAQAVDLLKNANKEDVLRYLEDESLEFDRDNVKEALSITSGFTLNS